LEALRYSLLVTEGGGRHRMSSRLLFLEVSVSEFFTHEHMCRGCFGKFRNGIRLLMPALSVFEVNGSFVQ